MKAQFTARENGPERLACEAEIVFEEGPLAGARLVGFSVWIGPDGDLYVTFPSRAFGAGTDRRYFEFLRDVVAGGTDDGSERPSRRIKAWILAELRAAASIPEYPPMSADETTAAILRGLAR